MTLACRNAACGSSSSGGGGSCPASPVHMVLTDASDWHFMVTQATAAAATEQPAGGAGGVAAAAAAAGSGASGAPCGLDFTLTSGESLTLFNCSSVRAPVLVSQTVPADLAKVRMVVHVVH
ncbi:hypothetical protein CHLRE_17g697701v5 [Chlamydomonas reinhardtii]|uniref:Uncharacterized protein n=1 Tax=Chlamydomonas reinhardtii TaxID=3055 RepID=A0A2K3CNP5_CHLRE|nr:uncharacterized protein CHLRE_17g697701v5 [Chlamydomonas reinhardtii]PNW69906.1 hypothetical protein CHLRE_17g697701v5 [Chlamydomonas reinhardtii]